MSDSESDQELVHMAGERKKSGSCCRRHPVACGVTLVVVGLVSLGVMATALGLRPFLQKTFKDTVNKVGAARVPRKAYGPSMLATTV